MARASQIGWTKSDVAYHMSITIPQVDALIELGLLIPAKVVERFRPADVRRLMDFLVDGDTANEDGQIGSADKSETRGLLGEFTGPSGKRPGGSEADVQQEAKRILRGHSQRSA